MAPGILRISLCCVQIHIPIRLSLSIPLLVLIIQGYQTKTTTEGNLLPGWIMAIVFTAVGIALSVLSFIVGFFKPEIIWVEPPKWSIGLGAVNRLVLAAFGSAAFVYVAREREYIVEKNYKPIIGLGWTVVALMYFGGLMRLSALNNQTPRPVANMWNQMNSGSNPMAQRKKSREAGMV